MTISSFQDDRSGAHRGARRTIIEMSRANLWLSILGLLGGFAVSAATGVIATAHIVVPPIVTETMRGEVDRLAATDARLEKAIENVDRTAASARQENSVLIRSQMSDLQDQLRESTRVTHELLLQLSAKWGGDHR